MLLRNNFSSGPDGTTITTTNSGNADDDAFAACFKTGANTINAYDLSPDRPTAEYVAELSTGAASGVATLAWVPGGGFSSIWLRMYVWFAVLPDNFNSPSIFFSETTAGVKCATIGVNSSGAAELLIANKDGSDFVATTAGPTAGEWFRIEAHIVYSTTVGTMELKWFDDPESDTPTETISASGWDLGAAAANNFYFGYTIADSNLEALRLSGIELNNTGYPGPLPYKVKGMPGIQPSSIAVHNDIF